jgi:hypothetical protein
MRECSLLDIFADACYNGIILGRRKQGPFAATEKPQLIIDL